MTEAQKNVNDAAEAINEALLALNKVVVLECDGYCEFADSGVRSVYMELFVMKRELFKHVQRDQY